MNKTKLILSVTGGAIGVAVAAASVLVWMAFSGRTANLEGDMDDPENEIVGLEQVRSKAAELSRKPVYPCAESVKAIESNSVRIAEWKAEALKLASRGDMVFKPTTPAAFKTFLVADAKRLSALPGAADGRLVKPDFSFGPFKDYISGDTMPTEGQLAVLQRQWFDISTMVEMLGAAGISELFDVAVKAAAAEQGQETNDRAKAKPRKPAAKKKGSSPDEKKPSAQTYVISFSALPAAFVRMVNALGSSERFMVVDDFSFFREKDAIADALGGEKKESSEAPSTGRRRRRRAEAEEAKPAEQAEKSGIVTDPARDVPLKVSMTVSVYDFGSLEETKPGDKGEEVKK